MHLLRLDNVDRTGREIDRSQDKLLVDVVAVHGLNETNIDAWLDKSDPENEVIWLRDLLPKTIRAARVLSVGYNAYAFSDSVDRIQQYAQTLVAELQGDRSLEGCPERPIIFICHGLGGILVKKALAYSSTRTSKHVAHLQSIFTSTFAILFFGTPHNGTHQGNWFVPPNAGVMQGFNESRDKSQLLSAVEKDSEALQMISDHFAPLMKQFHIFFFWEQLPTKLGNRTYFVVEESSAAPIIDDTERCGIPATHANMTKFPGPNNSSFRTVIEALVRYCRDAPLVIARRWEQALDLLAKIRSNEAAELTGTGFDVHNENRPFHYERRVSEAPLNKHFHVPQRVSSIFTGREDMSQVVKESFFAEVDDDMTRQQRRFIIYGIGGSGKTQFCCKFAQDHRDRFWAVFWIDATSAETARKSFGVIGKYGGLESTQSAGKHWLSHLEQPWLLIINNADDPSLDLPNLFPDGERGHILVTTRNPDFRIHGTVGSREFKGLKEREALLLLLRAADIRSPWTSSTEKSGQKITNVLGYLALALIQAGGLILQRICDVENYLAFYDQYRKEFSAKRRLLDAMDHNPYLIHSTWDLSLKSLQMKNTQGSRDATQLLNIVAFFHFEHIRVDIFTRALENRAKALDGLRSKPFSARFLDAIWSRLQQPVLLPEFLKHEPERLGSYRVRRALHELCSFSLISYDGRNETFSLHPVVHAWARDRLGPGGQALWRYIARNTFAESIRWPPGDTGVVDEEFRRDILPHLDLCLAACPIQIIDFKSHFGGYRLPIAIFLRYMVLIDFRECVLMAAKFGYVYLERGRFNDAATLLAMVKNALVQSRGYENEMTMKAMLALAATYWGLGRLKEAITLQKTVVEARNKVLGAEHHETLSAMDQLGKSYWLNGQYHEALELQTLTTERMKKILGPGHADTLTALDNLGVTLGSWHRYSRSMEVHRQVLRFRENQLGPTHVDTLVTINNLAMALFDLNRPIEAKELMLKVYNERKLKLGKEHPWTLWALCNLSKVESGLGLLQEAEDMLVEGIAAAKRSLGDDHLGVLMGCGELARVYARQRRYKEAEHLARDTLLRLEESRGPEHPDTVQTMWKMAQLFELQNEIEKAVEMCATAVKRVDMRLTKQHPLGEIVYSYYSKLQKRLETSKDGSSSGTIISTSEEVCKPPNFKFSRSKTS